MLHEIQLDEGLKVGNKISKKYMEFQRLKMNVKVTAQTLCGSVAYAMNYLLLSGHPSFIHAGATINFIRIIGRLFDLLNSKNLFTKGYKRPLKLADKAIWLSTIEDSISYLSKLTDVHGVALLQHRRKTFVLGLITAASSIRELALFLLTKSENPFSYIVTDKFSQDHLIIVSCIRGKNGFDNNPVVHQLKSALKRILLRVSIISSP